MLFSSPAIPDSLYVDATENTNCISIILIDFNLRSGVRIMIPYEHLRSTHCIAKKTKDFDLGKKRMENAKLQHNGMLGAFGGFQ